jgi:hypothetical protein
MLKWLLRWLFLTLDIAGGDLVGVRHPLRGAVPLLALRVGGVDLLDLRPVNVQSEREPHGGDVDLVAVCGRLDAVGDPTLQVLHEGPCVVHGALSDEPRRDELGCRYRGL